MANVKIIAPQSVRRDTLRVAAYCRVSSDSSDQLHSYAAQIKSYTELIGQHDGWELVDIYADEGLTGTRLDKREDFMRMMNDARKGKLDKVLVKSISRFARNTRDCLASLRELMALGVTVQFEKENIDTGTLTTELMVSVSGSLAQEESVSISKNQRMSYQRRMERGEFITCKAPFGYSLKDGKELEIIPEEAQLVRWVFQSYLSGHSLEWIAREMTKKGVPTTDGNERWQLSTVLYLLTNEKYTGDTLCQKTFASAFPFVKRRNHGEREQFYIENTHPAIITHDQFERAQELRLRRAQRNQKPRIQYPLSRKIICGDCGATFTRRTAPSGLVTWCCRRHDDNASDCPIGRIPESELYAAFVRMYHKLKQHESILLQPALRQLEDLNKALQRGNPAMLELNRAIADSTEQSYKISKLQTAGLLDADACTAKLNAINAKLTQLRGERRRLQKNEDLEDIMDALHRTADLIHNTATPPPHWTRRSCTPPSSPPSTSTPESRRPGRQPGSWPASPRADGSAMAQACSPCGSG